MIHWVSVSSFWRFLLPKSKTTSFKNSSSRYSDGHIIVLHVLLLCVVAVLRVFMTHDCRTNLPTGTDKVTWQIKWDQEARSRRIIWFKVLKTYELDEPYSFRFRKACRPIWSPLRTQAANKTNEPPRTECSEQNIRDKRQRKVWNISGRVGNVSEAERNQLGVSLRNSNRYLTSPAPECPVFGAL